MHALCALPSFDLDADIDVCTDTTDDVPPPPAKRANVDPTPKVFVHVSQDVPTWADMYDEVIRYNKQQDPALKRKQQGDLRVRKDGFKATLRVSTMDNYVPSTQLPRGFLRFFLFFRQNQKILLRKTFKVMGKGGR